MNWLVVKAQNGSTHGRVKQLLYLFSHLLLIPLGKLCSYIPRVLGRINALGNAHRASNTGLYPFLQKWYLMVSAILIEQFAVVDSMAKGNDLRCSERPSYMLPFPLFPHSVQPLTHF